MNRIERKGSLLIIAKSLANVNDENIRSQVVFDEKTRTKGLIEMDLKYYGFEITPINENELSLSGVVFMDPKMDVIPESFLTWGTKTFIKLLVEKIVKFCSSLKGTKYAKKLKTLEDDEFYVWILKEIKAHYQRKGWKYTPPQLE